MDVWLISIIFIAVSALLDYSHLTLNETRNQKKSDFPEFDGKNAKKAMIRMKKKYPKYKPVIVPEGSVVTMDYRKWRVRIYFNKNGKVIGSFIG